MIPAAFPRAEMQARLGRAQRRMERAGLAALLLTTDADIRYFTGFLTRFWESPTRPWYLVLPASGAPVAVIPEIGAHLMRQSWVQDIRCWPSPDYGDDGISLLAETLAGLVPEGEVIATPSHPGTHLRMPLDHWQALQGLLPGRRFAGDGGLTRDLRMVKSGAEIERIRAACAVADRAFARVPEIAGAGVPLAQVFRDFQVLCLQEGADWVPYLAGGAGPGGYGDVISPATAAPLAAGDVLMLDTGVIRDGYFCDFDRNFSVGPPAPEIAAAHARLIEATAAGLDAARPGATAADLFHAMDRVLTGGRGGTGRLGHGLGMQLTEPPSLHPADHTALAAGMVLTLEPVVQLAPDRIMVHEENIVLREDGAGYLSTPAGPALVQV